MPLDTNKPQQNTKSHHESCIIKTVRQNFTNSLIQQVFKIYIAVPSSLWLDNEYINIEEQYNFLQVVVYITAVKIATTKMYSMFSL